MEFVAERVSLLAYYYSNSDRHPPTFQENLLSPILSFYILETEIRKILDLDL